MIVRFKNLYSKSPDILKRVVGLIPFGYRMGKAYRETLRFLQQSDKWSMAEIHSYQQATLGSMLEAAIKNVPYYSKYGHLSGRSPWAILRDIEPISRKEVHDNLDRFLAQNVDRSRYHATYTGGSSGHPLKIYQDNTVPEVEWAFMIAQWMRAGYRPGDKRASFRGVEFKGKADCKVQRNPVYNELLLSPFDLTESALSQYVYELRKFKPRFLRGYPSAISALASFVTDRNIDDLPKVEAVLCGSESFSQGQRRLIQSAFGARFYSWYGMTEKVVLAGECEGSALYHCFPQYGITEVMDSNGNLSSSPGSSGEIVGTGFLNRAMPLIRYRMEDYSSIVGDRCNKCGRNHLLLGKVSGHRVQDYIVGRSGSLISTTALNMHDNTFESVRQFQFHQKRKGEVTLYLRVGDDFDEGKHRLILKSLRSKTASDVDFRIEVVDKIDTTGMGKGIYLRQELREVNRSTFTPDNE